MFNLQASINLNLAQGAASRIRTQIQSTLGGVKGTIDLQVNPRAQAEVARLGQSLAALREAVRGLDSASVRAAASVDRLAGSSARAGAAGQSAASGIGSSAAAARRAAAAYTEAADGAVNFGRQVGLATRRFLAFSVGAGGLLAMVGAIRAVVSEAVRFDLQLNKLAQVADNGARDVALLRGEIARLSTGLGVSSKDLAEAAVGFTQAGLSARDSAKALDVFAKAMSSPSFGSAAQTMEGMIALYQQFGKNVDKLGDQMGAINAVAKQFAVEADDLVTAVQKAGGAFAATGGKVEELVALMTAVRATTRESADEIATGLRSIFTYVQRSDTVEHLKAMGVNLRYTRQEAEALGKVDLEDQFVGPYKAVQRLAGELGKLRSTDPRYSQIVEDLGGVRQVGRVLPLLQQFETAQKAINVAGSRGRASKRTRPSGRTPSSPSSRRSRRSTSSSPTSWSSRRASRRSSTRRPPWPPRWRTWPGSPRPSSRCSGRLPRPGSGPGRRSSPTGWRRRTTTSRSGPARPHPAGVTRGAARSPTTPAARAGTRCPPCSCPASTCSTARRSAASGCRRWTG
jgi:TP901 family phage tail tape measure protein